MQAYQACKIAIYVLSSMCDPEARPPKSFASVLLGGTGGGASAPAALLTCGLPPVDLVKEAFSCANDLCQVCVARVR